MPSVANTGALVTAAAPNNPQPIRPGIAGPASVFSHRHPQETQGPQARPEVCREGIALVDLCGAWRNLGLGKVAHGIAQGVDVVTELMVEAGSLQARLGR